MIHSSQWPKESLILEITVNMTGDLLTFLRVDILEIFLLINILSFFYLIEYKTLNLVIKIFVPLLN